MEVATLVGSKFSATIVPKSTHPCSCQGREKHGGRNSNSGEIVSTPRVILSLHSQSGQSWSNIQIWSKTGQTRGVEVQILIFLDVFANLNYRIKNGLLRKLMQILFVNNLSDIFK